jgi:beta-galactosidase
MRKVHPYLIASNIGFTAVLFAAWLAGLALLLSAGPSQAAEPAPARERLSLDHGWLFHLGDIVSAQVNGHADSYTLVKAGNAPGAAAREFDDSDWRRLDLPHDWAVEGPFDAKENIAQGYRPRGIGWYRRYLRVDASERGRHFELQFDGIATHAKIWVNGHLVHRNWSGYSASNIDITPYLEYGDALNTVAVRVDAEAMEGWWYEGAGIYRHSWLLKREPVHVATDGLHITPKQLSPKRWQLPLEVTLANHGKAAAKAELELTVFDPQGREIARRRQRVELPLFKPTSVKLPVTIDSPQLWSLAQTRQYRVALALRQDGKLLDKLSMLTGFRSLRFDADRGFFLNGEPLKLQGVCIHQDHAGVGVALPDSIWAYRLRRLKELGANAIRFSHHAPAAEVLDMADRMGFLVMDENRNFNPSPDYMKQLEWMVRRDRHHPSVLLWSVFNEEPVQGSEVGYEMARRMVAAVKALDDSRPVTAAMNGGFFSDLNVSHAVDVIGLNYQVPDYDRLHKQRPGLALTSSEDTSAFMTRGEFRTDAQRNLIASYDDDFAPWGNSHRDAWAAIASRPYLAGGFVWTGFDYRGEPTPNHWPSTGSVFGIMDLNGFPKTAYFMHQVQWIKDRPLLHIAPHWNWTDAPSEGKARPIRVMVMGNMERVMLLLNGRKLGEQAIDPLRMNFFEVPFEPGKLEAVGYSAGREVARSVVQTTGPAVALQLLPDRSQLLGDGRDAMPITVQAVDAQGHASPLDASLLTFSISGPGVILGHGNGDPNSHEDEKGPTRRLFNGLAQLIVQSTLVARPQDLQISVSAAGLPPAQLALPVLAPAPAQQQPYVPQEAAPRSYLREWRISPTSAERPDPNQVLADNDMNTWGWGTPPMLEPAQAQAGWRLYRSKFSPRKNLADGRARLHFASILGRAELWLDGALLGRKSTAQAGPLSVPLPAGLGARQLTVLLEVEAGGASGISGDVQIKAEEERP